MSALAPYVTVAEVRRGFAEAIAGLGDGWRELPFPLRIAAAPAGFADHPFSLVPDLTEVDGRYRVNGDVGLRVQTRLAVLILSTLTPAVAEQLTSLDAAADAEQQLLGAILREDASATWRHHLKINLVSTTRTFPDDGGFLLSTVTFSVNHVLPLR